MYRSILAIIGFCFALLSAPSFSQSDSMFSAFDEVHNSTKNMPDLTAKRVKSWITSYKKSQKLNMPELQQSAVKEDQSAAEMMESLKASKQYNDLLAIVKSEGFNGVEQWTKVGMQVAQAYASITINKNEVNQQLKNSIAEIQNNSALSEQQKQFMINMAKQASGMVETMTQASQANKNAVKSHQGELQKLFDDK